MQSLLEQYLLNEEDVNKEPRAETSTEVLVKSDTEELPGLGLSPEKESTTENSVVPEKKFESVVVLVDPPRSGLHPVVSNGRHLFAYACASKVDL